MGRSGQDDGGWQAAQTVRGKARWKEDFNRLSMPVESDLAEETSGGKKPQNTLSRTGTVS